MKKYLIVFLLLQFAFICHAYSQQVGEWTAHMAYHDATQSIPVGNRVYVLSDGSLYSYDPEDTSIETYDKVNLLSDTDITHMVYNKNYQTMVIVYSNLNIDLLINEKEVYNMPDFMNKSMIQDKTLNHLFVKDEYIYFSTNFGLLVLDIKKKEITNSYILNKKVNASTQIGQTIYLATNEGIYTGKLTDNLLDNRYWTQLSPALFNNLIVFENNLLGYDNEGLYKIDSQSGESTLLNKQSYTYMNLSEDELIAGNGQTITLFKHLNDYKTIRTADTFYHLSYDKNRNTYWGSNGNQGLNGYKYNSANNTMEATVRNLVPNSPQRNLSEYMQHNNGYLTIAGGGINLDRFNNPGTILRYKDHEWSYFQEEDIEKSTGLPYKDITSIAEDPAQSGHFYATAAGEGLYEFKDGKFIKLYNESNSSLVSIFPGNPNYIRLNGLQYDNDNHLWMLSSSVKNVINIYKDNKFIALNYTEIENKSLARRILFDQRGWAWILFCYKNPSLFCLNTNHTLENTKDDETKYFTSFSNQDGGTINAFDLYSIAEDKNGAIWIGSSQGPLVINNPSRVFENNFYVTQIKIPRNDGTNNADFLLANESISAICIDGANRKWLGTLNNGIYLVSEDGLETIHHFTTENSPLPSDMILSVAIDPVTGIVYIGTEKGLISYRSDATEAGESFSDEAHVFPNPVNPDYDGLITVTGLVRDSNVKITDTSGKLVHTGTSTGGQFTWNGKNRSGKRVASGVYFVLATNSEGKEGIVTKILMIK